jgi:hypothetical protein
MQVYTMYYWSVSWGPICNSIVLSVGNKEVNFIFQIYSKSREKKCQHKWRNLMSIDWVSLQFLEWRVSVLLMFIFICLRFVMAGLEIKFTFHLWQKISENFTSRVRNSVL